MDLGRADSARFLFVSGSGGTWVWLGPPCPPLSAAPALPPLLFGLLTFEQGLSTKPGDY